MVVHRIILDTDLAMGDGANIDDGFALALAHADPNISLDMITTVNGNTDVESATILTSLVAKQLGIQETPIVRGAATALLRPNQKRTPAPHVLNLKDSSQSLCSSPAYAPMAIIQHILANPGQITVVAIGPLTNIALALILEPRIVTEIKELVIMGGSFFGSTGSREKPGETNVFTDPEAAQAVLRSGIPQRWVGLDCTLRVRLSKQQAADLAASPSEFVAFAGKTAGAYIDGQAARYPGRPTPDSCPIHDALAVAIVSRPDICKYRDVFASVITGEGEARGVMITDLLEGPMPPEPNCRVAADINTGEFENHFFGLLRTV
ncbi:inosine uridine-preferring nucleoside hydrolase protein [Pochonia chlamydosporia 170]|uniref:Inosine uridine-preferring nucleoside hydrolase protein n=1 Tax=Pochonia chlamydosporia 170 TaxID=1380566 RepID=A0A179FVP0_METCM|nr:inosine uridine-preferring nucleoside hydrolase protein [Pochonia chlamydosporia 170]OAQ69682.1 inosine uridine-preferring nucleoside hydrolase protein [Pochonia chlamydosporia 170]